MKKLVPNQEVLASISQGQSFGEKSILEKSCRNGTAIATQDSHLIFLGADDYLQFQA